MVIDTEKAIVNTHARLREVFHHWFKAAENYSNKEEFRISINSCIQAVRNVTFVLQKNKHDINNFNNWYSQWQQAMIADPIMGWCVDARNFIVKEGDLDTRSIAKVMLLNSHNETSEKIFDVNPSFTGIQIAEIIKEKHLPQELSIYGYLQVERQWIVNNLKDVELLSALVHAFTVLSLLIDDIDKQKGPSFVYCPKDIGKKDFEDALDFLSDEEKPDCMLDFEKYRTTNYNLGTGEQANLIIERIEFDEEIVPDLKRKYGDIKPLSNIGKTLNDRVKYYLDFSKKLLEVDGFYITTVVIFDSSDVPHVIQTVFRDNEDKYLFWKSIAKRIKRLRATMIITVGDTWYAKLDKTKPILIGGRVADMPNKDEVIMVVGMTRKGESLTLGSFYDRENETIKFKPNEIIKMDPGFLNPVKKAFKKLTRP